MPARMRSIAPLAAIRALVLVLVLFRLLLLASTNVFQDEAYYWMWGQHPALSYFDHPPLNAWLQSLSGALFGWNKFALRLPVVLAFLADLVLLRLISQRIAPAWPEHFWLTLLLFLVTPVLFVVTGWALPDYLLLTCALAALYFLVCFIDGWPHAPRWRYLYLGATCLGLAGLAKYNAAFFGIGLALYVVLAPRMRPLLARPQLYLAAGIAVALQMPVLVWNLTEGFASYGFVLGDRHAVRVPGLEGIRGWLMVSMVAVGPFLVVPMLAFALRRGGAAGTGLAQVTFWLSSLSMAGLSYFTATLFHWNLVAYVVALPFLALHLKWRWLAWLHILYGTTLLVVVFVNFSIGPLGDPVAMDDEATSWAYGWTETAEAVRAAQREHGADFIATTDYTSASLLGFALGTTGVTSLNPRRDQYDYWFDTTAHAGEDAILYTDIWRTLREEVRARFTEIVLLSDEAVIHQGRRVNQRQLYLAKGYIAPVE
ncbi:MAG: glycosyltransferase family 39 protein [Devosia sp.]|nr:glycosyltransferase family 39 protein [Devosia sp.]